MEGACLHPGEVPTPDPTLRTVKDSQLLQLESGAPTDKEATVPSHRGYARRQVPCTQPLPAGWARKPASRSHIACLPQGKASCCPPQRCAHPSPLSLVISEPIKTFPRARPRGVFPSWACLVTCFLSASCTPRTGGTALQSAGIYWVPLGTQPLPH